MCVYDTFFIIWYQSANYSPIHSIDNRVSQHVQRCSALLSIAFLPFLSTTSSFAPVAGLPPYYSYFDSLLLQKQIMTSCQNLDGNFTVESDSCRYTDESIISDYW